MIVEPCCCDNQLPLLIRTNRDTAFVTNGDVLLHHILHAASCLVGNKMDIVIVIPHVNVAIVSKMVEFFRRGWLNTLYVLTEDKAEVFGAFRSNCAEFIDNVILAETKKVGSDVLALLGTSGIVFTGPILTEQTFALTSYGVTSTYLYMAEDIVDEMGEYAVSPLKQEKHLVREVRKHSIKQANKAMDAILRPYISKFRLLFHHGDEDAEFNHKAWLLNFKYLWKR